MPSSRNRRAVSPELLVGATAGRAAVPCAVKMTSTAALKPSTSNEPSSFRNFMRLSDARLQAELSRCTYSEHGFEALMRPVFDAVCHRLIVVSYCRPGSAHSHAAFDSWR